MLLGHLFGGLNGVYMNGLNIIFDESLWKDYIASRDLYSLKNGFMTRYKHE